MPYKDPEKEREYRKEQMRRRREEARGKVAVADPEPEPIPDPKPESIPEVEAQAVLRLPNRVEKAEQIAKDTRKLLETRGWCLWKATKLDDEILVIVRDESVRGFPDGYPVFTDDELQKLWGDKASLGTYRMVIEAKKTFGEVSVQ